MLMFGVKEINVIYAIFFTPLLSLELVIFLEIICEGMML